MWPGVMAAFNWLMLKQSLEPRLCFELSPFLVRESKQLRHETRSLQSLGKRIAECICPAGLSPDGSQSGVKYYAYKNDLFHSIKNPARDGGDRQLVG